MVQEIIHLSVIYSHCFVSYSFQQSDPINPFLTSFDNFWLSFPDKVTTGHINLSLSCKPRYNGAFSRNNLPRIKYGAYVKNLDHKKVKEYIGFQCLLTELQMHTLILFELKIFLKQY